MALHKSAIIEILEHMALLLELQGENVFVIRAYQKAARQLEAEPRSLKELIDNETLKDISGFGKAMVEKVTTLYQKGRLPYYEELKKSIPKGLLDIVAIRGVGPKKARVLYETLKISTVSQLKKACQQGKLQDLPGFGKKTEDKILSGIEFMAEHEGEFLLSVAHKQAHLLIKHLNTNPKIKDVTICGSLRRSKEVVHDIDILATASDPKSAMKTFVSFPNVKKILAQGETKSSISLTSGLQVDFRVVKKNEHPFALQYFTGNKDHNTELRSLAKKKKLQLNEYGLFKGKKTLACKNEEAIYQALGLHYIPPELREGRGELKWAAQKKAPVLIQEKDIKGIFHVHTTYSDGVETLEKMIQQAILLKYTYIGITDHSQSAYYAGGLKASDLKKQKKEIDVLRKKYSQITIFWGVESDILKDGSLDYPEPILKEFDFIIASIHNLFKLSEAEQTRRLVKALQNPYTKILGHPTGRLLTTRPGYEVDMPQVIQAASDYGKSIEINANPYRLDLDWRLGSLAKEKKVPLCINPDAHSFEGFASMPLGVAIARKGGLTKGDILNTRSVSQIKTFFQNGEV